MFTVPRSNHVVSCRRRPHSLVLAVACLPASTVEVRTCAVHSPVLGGTQCARAAPLKQSRSPLQRWWPSRIMAATVQDWSSLAILFRHLPSLVCWTDRRPTTSDFSSGCTWDKRRCVYLLDHECPGDTVQRGLNCVSKRARRL